MRLLLIAIALASRALAADLTPQCLGIDPLASAPFGEVTKSEGCHVRTSSSGYPLPDPECTPGARNPTVTLEILRNPAFRTKCARDKATSAAEKRGVYAAYGIAPPRNNRGKNQTCELDHVVPLEAGGSDALANIWPQCGPVGVPLPKRWFKRKDALENLLTRETKAGQVGLEEAQRAFAVDWGAGTPK